MLAGGGGVAECLVPVAAAADAEAGAGGTAASVWGAAAGSSTVVIELEGLSQLRSKCISAKKVVEAKNEAGPDQGFCPILAPLGNGDGVVIQEGENVREQHQREGKDLGLLHQLA